MTVSLETSVTQLLDIELPVIQAGMSWVSSCSELPLAVSNAGGLGVIAAGPMTESDLRQVLQKVRANTDRPYAVNLPLNRRGVGEIMQVLLGNPPPVMVGSQGAPAKYVRQFQDLGTRCLHVIASVEHAKKAVDAGADALIVTGAAAGGHPPSSMVSTLVLLRAVCSGFPMTPIIGSGGFADGAGLAAALALGAGAAQFGTRFIASTEANVHHAYRRAVLDASVVDTVVIGRDLGVIRVLANEFTGRMDRLEADGASIEVRRAEFISSTLKMAALDGDVANGRVEAGQAAGLIAKVQPAGQIVTSIVEECVEVIARLAGCLDVPGRLAHVSLDQVGKQPNG